MGSARGMAALLRDAARHDDPRSVLAYADVKGWELAEGLGSDAAAEAVGRKDWERIIPGLSARGTYKAICWAALIAFVLITALSWLPPSGAVETAETMIQITTAGLGILAAAWSILSEMRGWEGSDAATWYAKGRVKAFETRIAPRRDAIRNTMIAIGDTHLVVYRVEEGMVARAGFAPGVVDDVSLEPGARHMVLRLTVGGEIRRFEWLVRHAAFEAAVKRFAGVSRSLSRPANGLTGRTTSEYRPTL